MVYDQNFLWGKRGGGWGGGGNEGCLKWDDGGGGAIKGSFQKHLKTGDGLRQNLFVGGWDF